MSVPKDSSGGAQPLVPLVLEILPLDEIEIRRRSQHDSGMWVQDPARGTMTGLAGKRWAKVAAKNNLGTDRPTAALVVPDPKRENLYLIPVSGHPQAFEVSYTNGQPYINLLKMFTYLNRIVPAGTREFYKLQFAPTPVKIDNVEYAALMMPLKRVENRHEKSESEKAAAKAKADARKVAPAPKANPEGAPALPTGENT